MDFDLDLDEVMGSKKNDEDAKNKNVIPQILSRLRKNDTTLTKVVIKNDPVKKTSLSVARALKTNTSLTSLSLYKVKIADDAAKELAEALKENKTLSSLTLVETELTGDGMYDLMKAIRENTTLTNLKINNGKKYWTSWVESALPDNLGENKTITKMQISPIRQIATQNALDKIGLNNKKGPQTDFGNDDTYEYVYDPNWQPSDEEDN